MGIFEGQLRVHKGDRFALVASRFNEFIVDRLVGGATDCINRHGGSEAQIDLIRVPGSFELPQVALQVARSGHYAGVVVLGAVIRGGTPHFDMIANEVTKGAAQVGLETGVPMLYAMDLTEYLPDEIFAGFNAIQDLNRDAFYYARRLVDGVHGHMEEIDAVLTRFAEHWKIHRMAVVDRNLLRLGVYELMFLKEIPFPIIINEALEIVK